jgi:hypothetical protein
LPYIKDENNLRHDIYVGNKLPQNPGELNFAITMMLKDYIAEKGQSYQTINDILGALNGASLEFYRRIAVVYENGKISTNGDVYSNNTENKESKSKSNITR